MVSDERNRFSNNLELCYVIRYDPNGFAESVCWSVGGSLGQKRLLILTDIIVALFAMVLVVVGTISDTFPLWLVFVSLFIRAIAQTFQMPTIQSILPTMVPEEELTRINGQLGMVQSANFIIAPAIGAFLFTVIPINWLILLDVLGAVFGVGLLVL